MVFHRLEHFFSRGTITSENVKYRLRYYELYSRVSLRCTALLRGALIRYPTERTWAASPSS